MFLEFCQDNVSLYVSDVLVPVSFVRTDTTLSRLALDQTVRLDKNYANRAYIRFVIDYILFL